MKINESTFIEMEYMDGAALMRGRLINALTVLEKIIDIYLSHHFADTNESRDELLECVFATKRLTFENKRILFDYLTTKYNLKYKEQYLKEIHAKLKKYNDVRNTLAHSAIDPYYTNQKTFNESGSITFVVYEKSLKQVSFSFSEIKSLEKEIYEYVELCSKMIKS